MIFTLSSCMVSQKTFDEKCCKLEDDIAELKSRCDGMDMKEQLLREAINDLQNTPKKEPIAPHDPANNQEKKMIKLSKLLNEDVTKLANIVVIGEKSILENGNEQ